MNKQLYEFTIELSLTAPFLSHKSGAQKFGYDMSMLRDADNKPVFLGSQIRGNLLHILKNPFKSCLEDSAKLDRVIGYFGKESDDSNEPERATFNFDYYWKLAQDLPTPPTLRYRIGIDENTGTTVKGNLQVIESLFPCNTQGIKFIGNITAQLTQAEAEICHVLLSKALHYLPAIGALKGTGFGRIESATCTVNAISKPSIEIPENTTDRIGIYLKLDRPFCIAKPHLPNANRFVSEDFILGNAIIGAIAQQYRELKKGQSWFDKIHVRHAFATSAASIQRARALPLSLALFYGDQDQLVDLANMPDPEKIYLLDNNAPAFQPDWKDKDFTSASQKCDLPKTSYQRQLIVRTAIKDKTHIAKDEALFSLECIEPKDDVWYTEINLSRLGIEEKDQAIKTLKQILAYPLCGIGKTKARADISICPTPILNYPEIKPIDGKRYIITLQTQARLFAEPSGLNATGDAKTLKDLYAEYWHKQSKQQLKLSHYFAQQTRVGGNFYWRRYRNNEPYQPEWLTQAGSVFVLEAIGDDIGSINDLLKEWQERGLPPAEDRGSDTWQSDPFIRENGFGEIRVNDVIHSELASDQGGEWL